MIGQYILHDTCSCFRWFRTWTYIARTARPSWLATWQVKPMGSNSNQTSPAGQRIRAAGGTNHSSGCRATADRRGIHAQTPSSSPIMNHRFIHRPNVFADRPPERSSFNATQVYLHFLQHTKMDPHPACILPRHALYGAPQNSTICASPQHSPITPTKKNTKKKGNTLTNKCNGASLRTLSSNAGKDARERMLVNWGFPIRAPGEIGATFRVMQRNTHQLIKSPQVTLGHDSYHQKRAAYRMHPTQVQWWQCGDL
jgi:hypothetical protein